MITYASYLPDRTDISRNAYVTCIVNCLYSLVAGVAVFGVVGFMAKSQGVAFEEAIKGGPQLAFVVYPKAISLLPSMNSLFGIIFFLMLILAGLTSGVSLIEAFTCSVTDKFDWPRQKVVSVVCTAGFFGSLIFTSRGGLYVLDIADHFITNYGLVIGGLLECFIVGWILKAVVIQRHVSSRGSALPGVWNFFIRYTTPLILIALVVLSIKNDLAKNYGDYPTDQLVIYGGGWLLICMLAALVLAFSPWRPEKLSKKHRPGEDDLLV